jgi:hypothetical protein
MHDSATVLLIATLLLAPAAVAEEEPQQGVSVPRDLFAVITLRGKPCGQVKSYEKRAENDYLVTCESGHRYRVHVTEDQRVVVEER